MKRTLEQMKLHIKENKKKVAAFSVAIVLLLGGSIYAATLDTPSHEEAKGKVGATKLADKNNIKKEKKEDKKKEADKKKEEAKKEQSSDDKKVASNKVETKKNTASSGGSSSSSSSASSSASSGSAGNSSSSKSVEKTKQKVWVVDQPAWEETIQKPVYDTRNYWVASNWDNSIEKIFYDLDECQSWIGSVGGGGYYKDKETYIKEYTNETIYHDEVGHWEYR